MGTREKVTITLYLVLFCLFLTPSPLSNSAIALASGMILSNTLGNPRRSITAKLAKYLLQASVVLMGFSLDLNKVIDLGIVGIAFAVSSVVITMVLGLILIKWIKIPFNTGYLITVGTAICGGSAIASVAPAMDDVDSQEISIALATVFLFNAIALFTFPGLGDLFELYDEAYGYFCAIAIHDTSSVVGAASFGGDKALDTAVLVKLGRALLIIPVVLITSYKLNDHRQEHKQGAKFPKFIFLFIMAFMSVSFFPRLQADLKFLSVAGKKLLVGVLFLVGLNFSFASLKKVGTQPLQLGLALWLVVICFCLIVLKSLAPYFTL